MSGGVANLQTTYFVGNVLRTYQQLLYGVGVAYPCRTQLTGINHLIAILTGGFQFEFGQQVALGLVDVGYAVGPRHFQTDALVAQVGSYSSQVNQFLFGIKVHIARFTRTNTVCSHSVEHVFHGMKSQEALAQSRDKYTVLVHIGHLLLVVQHVLHSRTIQWPGINVRVNVIIGGGTIEPRLAQLPVTAGFLPRVAGILYHVFGDVSGSCLAQSQALVIQFHRGIGHAAVSRYHGLLNIVFGHQF